MATKKYTLPILDTPLEYSAHAENLLRRFHHGDISEEEAKEGLRKAMEKLRKIGIAYDTRISFDAIREMIDRQWIERKHFNNKSLTDINTLVYYQYKHPTEARKIKPDIAVRIHESKNPLHRACIEAIPALTRSWMLYKGTLDIDRMLQTHYGREALKSEPIRMDNWLEWYIDDAAKLEKTLHVWTNAIPVLATFVYFQNRSVDELFSVLSELKTRTEGTSLYRCVEEGIHIGQTLYKHFGIHEKPLFATSEDNTTHVQKCWKQLEPLVHVLNESDLKETVEKLIPHMSSTHAPHIDPLELETTI